MKVLIYWMAAIAVVMSTYCSIANAEEEADEHRMMLLVGPSLEKNLVDGSKSIGTYMALEFTAIENELEIEVGSQYLSAASPKEIGGAVIFKKPFELAPGVELALGLGPTVWRKTSSPNNGIQYCVSFASDFMFWSSKRVGWYLSPGYTYGVGHSTERSLGVSAGLLFAL